MNALPIGTKIVSPTTTYTITGVLGSGGFGITYRATFTHNVGTLRLKSEIALKEHFLKADCQREDDTMTVSYSAPARDRVERSRKDFVGEARRLSSISGKNNHIVTVSEVFEANNTAYYAMEMLDGMSLKEYVDLNGPMSESEMLAVMRPIVDAVAFLHENHITHLDIKPQNIMLATDGDGRQRPILIDFGLSKHYDEDGNATSTINTQGFSDGYAPIEQYTGITTFSPASDVYSLAATMVFCLTGQKLPRALDLNSETLEKILPTGISPELRGILIGALSLHASDRPADASEIFPESDDWTKMNLAYPNVPASTHINVQTKEETPVYEAKIEVVKKESSSYLKPILIGLGVILLGLLGYWLLIKNSPSATVTAAEETEINTDVLLPIYKDGKWGYADEEGNILIELSEDFDRIFTFNDGLARVEKDGISGFIDKTGKIVVPLEYSDADSFSEGLARVEKDGISGYIDKTGKIVVPLEYHVANSFSEGLSAVEKEGEWGFIDKTGKVVILLQCDWAFPFSEGLATVVKDNKWGFIDKTGKVVVPLEYDGAYSFSEGLALVRKDDKEGFIDKTGKVVVPLQYDYVEGFREGLALVSKDDKWGFIDKTGKFVVPLEYDHAQPFREDLALVRKDDELGFIDKTGKFVVPLEYDFVGEFNEGLLLVGQKGKRGYIDKTGKVVVPLEYDDAVYFIEGLARVEKDGKWGFLDHFGNFRPDKE